MKDQKEANWQLLGQLISRFVTLFTLIRNTFAEMGVGIDIVGWVLGDGQQSFVATLQALGEQYGKTQRWRTVDEHTIDVNLDALPTLPFDGATVVWPKSSSKKGWVKVERRGDDLHVGGRKVILHLEDGQKTGYILGSDLRKALEGKDVLHPNILDALFDNFHLIPESWKQDEQGRTLSIFFFLAVVDFRASGGGLCVRCLFWGGGQWRQGLCRLDFQWGAQYPAALLAS